MFVRQQRMKEIIHVLGDKEYYPRQILTLIQTITGFHKDVCIAYIRDMQNIGILRQVDGGKLKVFKKC